MLKRWLLKIWGITAQIEELKDDKQAFEDMANEYEGWNHRLQEQSNKKDEQIEHWKGEHDRVAGMFVEATQAALEWKKKAEKKTVLDITQAIEKEISTGTS